MKTKMGIKIINVLGLMLALAGCSLNSSEGGSLVANQVRTSRTGGVTAENGMLAIDIKSIDRPPLDSPKWGYVNRDLVGVNAFLSIAESKQVQISQELFETVDIFFWGDLNSRSTSKLQLGNQISENQFFSELDPKNFQFEISIWDYYTDGINPQTNKKFDFLGYSYFGRKGSSKQVGVLNGSSYRVINGKPLIEISFSDSLGEISLVFDIDRNNQTMSGEIYLRPSASSNSIVFFGYFTNHKICALFNCN